MNFKLHKTDIYLILTYYAIAIPVACFDYADYEVKMDLFYEILLFALSDAICLFLIVFWIFPKYFAERKYVQLMVYTVITLTIVGHIWINIYCAFVSTCTGNWFSFKAAYAGLNQIISSFAILGVIVLGKKLYDAQSHYLKMEKEKKESELLRLNAQINPHFLFNNLNTVDSLIDTNPKAAKIYLNKLSQLYRYLIASKDQEVVELGEEMEFVQNYIYLIESRFGDAFQFEIIDQKESKESIFIPPGALQTLLENIVKHNQATPTNPIKSSILINGKEIKVSNNLVPKKENIDSMGTGLQNLKSRYKLLTDKIIQINKRENFEVSLPLIKQVD